MNCTRECLACLAYAHDFVHWTEGLAYPSLYVYGFIIVITFPHILFCVLSIKFVVVVGFKCKYPLATLRVKTYDWVKYEADPSIGK